MANGDVTFFLPGDPRRRFTPLTADVPDMPETLTLGDIYSPQQNLPMQQEKTFGEYLKEAGHGPVSFWTQRADLARNAQAMQIAPILMEQDRRRQALATQQQKDTAEQWEKLRSDFDWIRTQVTPENQASMLQAYAKGRGLEAPPIFFKELLEQARTNPENVDAMFKGLSTMPLHVFARNAKTIEGIVDMMKKLEPPNKAFAPTAPIQFLTEAYRQLGKQYRPGDPLDPEANKLALDLEHEWRREGFMPKGTEGSIAWRAADLARSRGLSKEQVNAIFERASRDARFGLAYLGAAGAKAGQYGVELGEFQEPPPALPPPGQPAALPTTGQVPTRQMPSGGEPGKTPLQRRQEIQSIGGKAGDVAEQMAKFNIVQGYVDQIDRLSKPLITAQKAPESWWQSARIAGGRVTNYDQLAKYYNSQVEAFLGQLSRTVGAQVGVLTQLDVDAMRNLLPTSGDTMAQREGKIGSLKAILRLNQEAHKARLTSGGELPPEKLQQYRDAIDAQIAKIMQAEQLRRKPATVNPKAQGLRKKYGY